MQELDDERLARSTAEAQLADERLARSTTEAQLADERAAHRNAGVEGVEAQLAVERQEHLATKEKLRYELLSVSDEVLASSSEAENDSYIELCAQYGVPCRLPGRHTT
jgi:hypothetical protein